MYSLGAATQLWRKEEVYSVVKANILFIIVAALPAQKNIRPM